MLRACWSQCTQLVEPWYDPLGFASPFILQGRRILQHLCDKNLQWDETVPQSIRDNWQEWKRNIQQLPGVMMHRCLLQREANWSKTAVFIISWIPVRKIMTKWHIFEQLMKTTEYFVMLWCQDHVWLLWSLYLELTAVTLAVKVATHLKQESDIKVDEEMFWTDSRVVLSYIQNTKRCFTVTYPDEIWA